MGGFIRGLLIAMLLVAGFLNVSPALAEDGVDWRMGDTTYLAGRDLTIDRKLDGSLTATGESVTIVYSSRIAGDAWLAARRVAVEGEIGGSLSIHAQNAIVNGRVKGDVAFYGNKLTLGPDAKIDGNLNYYASSQAQIDRNAAVGGDVGAFAFSNSSPFSWWPSWSTGSVSQWSPALFMRDALGGSALLVGIFAALAAAFFPALGESLRAANASTVLSFLVGGAWVIGMPVAAVMSVLTIIGIPLAVAILLLWPLGIFAGLIMAVLLLGTALSSSRYVLGEENGLARRLIGVGAATLILWIGFSLPLLGAIIWFATACIGTGVMLRAGANRIF